MVNDFIRAFTSVKNARASIREDREIILQEIAAHFGSFDQADNYIRTLLDKKLSPSWFEKYK
jgi:hypothetical protein